MSEEERTSDVELMRHLSPSKIESAMMCPLKMKYRYIDKVPALEYGPTAAGTAIHECIEKALLKKIMTGSLPDPKETDDHFDPAWTEEIRHRESKDSFIGWDWKGEKVEDVKAQCRALLNYVAREYLPKLKPKFVERETKRVFQSDIGPFLVWGYIDLLEEDGTLKDWKTTQGEVSKNKKKLGMQLPYYSFEAVEMTGVEVTQAKKVFMVRGARPRIEEVSYVITPRVREWFVSVASEVWKMTQANAYVPNNGGWWCCEKWCDYHGPCQGDLK